MYICKTKANNMKKQTIETVAKILLSNRISFNYDNDFLKVTDQTIRYELFASAVYHSETKKLVLMCDDYSKEISFDTFLNYFSVYKSK